MNLLRATAAWQQLPDLEQQALAAALARAGEAATRSLGVPLFDFLLYDGVSAEQLLTYVLSCHWDLAQPA